VRQLPLEAIDGALLGGAVHIDVQVVLLETCQLVVEVQQ